MEKKKQLVFLEDSEGIVKTKNKIGNLFVLSDDEIKEHDWFYYKHFGEDIITQAKETTDLVNLNNPDRYFKKIIATTDKLENCQMPNLSGQMYLPQIPQLFIEHFISEYNKGNIITEVEVEYEEIEEYIPPRGCFEGDFYQGTGKFKLKINPDNTINIKPVKDGWNREEVVNLIKLYQFNSIGKDLLTNTFTDKWIEENLF